MKIKKKWMTSKSPSSSTQVVLILYICTEVSLQYDFRHLSITSNSWRNIKLGVSLTVTNVVIESQAAAHLIFGCVKLLFHDGGVINS